MPCPGGAPFGSFGSTRTAVWPSSVASGAGPVCFLGPDGPVSESGGGADSVAPSGEAAPDFPPPAGSPVVGFGVELSRRCWVEVGASGAGFALSDFFVGLPLSGAVESFRLFAEAEGQAIARTTQTITSTIVPARRGAGRAAFRDCQIASRAPVGAMKRVSPCSQGSTQFYGGS